MIIREEETEVEVRYKVEFRLEKSINFDQFRSSIRTSVAASSKRILYKAPVKICRKTRGGEEVPKLLYFVYFACKFLRGMVIPITFLVSVLIWLFVCFFFYQFSTCFFFIPSVFCLFCFVLFFVWEIVND